MVCCPSSQCKHFDAGLVERRCVGRGKHRKVIDLNRRREARVSVELSIQINSRVEQLVRMSRDKKCIKMFRNPRKNVEVTSSDSVLPSVGRPPTPPLATSIVRNSSPYFGPTATPTPDLSGMKAHLVQHSPASRSTVNDRKTNLAISNPRTRSQPNQSILKFFAKSDKAEGASSNGIDDQELFFTIQARMTLPPA